MLPLKYITMHLQITVGAFFIGDSYDSEINYLEEWISERFNWLDQNINEL